MYTVKYQSRFKKHLQNLLRAQRFSKKDFKSIEELIVNGTPIPEKYDDHVIKSHKPRRALFIKGSWLLIYEYHDDQVTFLDVGRHGEI